MTMIYKPSQTDTGRYLLEDINGNVYTRTKVDQKPPSPITVSRAVEQNMALHFTGKQWRIVNMKMFFEATQSIPTNEQQVPTENSEEHKELVDFIHNRSYSVKPKELFIDELKWKYAVRSVIRAQNVLVVGPTGSGKTMLVKWLAGALQRPLHIINLGATQDPRASLIGYTHFDSTTGTFFSESPFVKAIQEPNSIILLDEVSRANPEAFNILMTVLDPHQRYLRLDEKVDSPVINVHPTVTFIGTANIGNEYTSTRVMDRALTDRFVTIEMDYLDKEGEYNLLSELFPTLSEKHRQNVSDIVDLIRTDVKNPDGQLEKNISTRHSIEMGSLLNDGFTIEEVLDIVVYPNYDGSDGLDSERTYVRQLLQSKLDSSSSEEELTMDTEQVPISW
jgi:nitric oxide reductase NorQ protein